ncbi:transporter family-2 protein [Cognatiyoonia sediminum]|uniref:Transporter family-2 protein n=1 Tax=Cognatiyoonia sediminum TaxID=1508389 RepID=A0A1M5NGD6_9RHOB|nr:DMT family transporter [Cognatiyoonia sediminum]SHG88289.1 transporter family-2 protein [Cognatiyoonia sediminum]
MTTAPLYSLIAFLTGGLLTLMVLTNGTLAVYGTLLFSSWVPHVTGTVAALAILAVLKPKRAKPLRPPLWAYLAGVGGAFTVMLTSATVNTSLALSGTIALGLAGQVVFSLFADIRGLFGLPKKRPSARDLTALGMILSGALLLVLMGGSQ